MWPQMSVVLRARKKIWAKIIYFDWIDYKFMLLAITSEWALHWCDATFFKVYAIKCVLSDILWEKKQMCVGMMPNMLPSCRSMNKTSTLKALMGPVRRICLVLPQLYLYSTVFDIVPMNGDDVSSLPSVEYIWHSPCEWWWFKIQLFPKSPLTICHTWIWVLSEVTSAFSLKLPVPIYPFSLISE